MADTLGGLVDKLSICNMKLFFEQEKVHDAARNHEGLEADTVKRLTFLNRQRNTLMTEIDQLLADAVSSGMVDVDERPKTP